VALGSEADAPTTSGSLSHAALTAPLCVVPLAEVF
jgi:hypothetical protein